MTIERGGRGGVLSGCELTRAFPRRCLSVSTWFSRAESSSTGKWVDKTPGHPPKCTPESLWTKQMKNRAHNLRVVHF